MLHANLVHHGLQGLYFVFSIESFHLFPPLLPSHHLHFPLSLHPSITSTTSLTITPTTARRRIRRRTVRPTRAGLLDLVLWTDRRENEQNGIHEVSPILRRWSSAAPLRFILTFEERFCFFDQLGFLPRVYSWRHWRRKSATLLQASSTDIPPANTDIITLIDVVLTYSSMMHSPDIWLKTISRHFYCYLNNLKVLQKFIRVVQ